MTKATESCDLLHAFLQKMAKTQRCNLQSYGSTAGIGWQIFAEYVDKGFSGTKEFRPELNRLMEDAHRRRSTF